MPIHSEILPEICQLNSQFVPVLNYIQTYKPELGYLLQRLVESYNMIFIGQFDAYYKNENAKEKHLVKKEIALSQQEKAIGHKRYDLYTQQDMVKSVVISKDMQITELSERLEQTEKQLQQLQDIITSMRKQAEVSEESLLKRVQ